jgi:hypothetical protein
LTTFLISTADAVSSLSLNALFSPRDRSSGLLFYRPTDQITHYRNIDAVPPLFGLGASKN